MIYPKEFVEKVKKVFPDWKGLHKQLDWGSVWVGRYLDDSRYSISTNDILNAKSLAEIQEKALKAKEIDDLYDEWLGLPKKEA